MTGRRPPRAVGRLAAAATRRVNPRYLALLRSRRHGLVSPWLVGLEFTGRRTGRPYRLPIGYAQVGDRVLVATDAAWRWNLHDDRPVEVWLRGRRRNGTARAVDDADSWSALLARRPVVGRLAGIRRGADGRPGPDDLRRAAARGWTLLEIHLDRTTELADLAGRTAVVTGATSGIGRAAALGLARRGARVLAVGRDPGRGTELATHPGIAFVAADLSSLDGVRAVAAAVPDGPLDVLVHSAGGHVLERRTTPDGIEANWAVNHVAKVLLTDLLADRLTAARGRVVVVGSPVVAPGRLLRLDRARRRPAVPLRALLDAGLATAVWSVELGRRLAGSGVTVVDLDPGLVRTRVSRTWPGPLRVLDRAVQAVAGAPADQAGADVVWLATTPELPGPFVRGGRAARVPRSTFDPDLGARVWRRSRELAGLGAAS